MYLKLTIVTSVEKVFIIYQVFEEGIEKKDWSISAKLPYQVHAFGIGAELIAVWKIIYR